MFNLRKGSSEQKLAGFFATLQAHAVATAVPGRAAFSKARKGLSEKVFGHLNRLAIERFRAGWSTPLWQGFRLLGRVNSRGRWHNFSSTARRGVGADLRGATERAEVGARLGSL